jgi:hypothetical protein
MADAADLIMRASVEGARESVKNLDDIAASSVKAEKAAEGVGAGTKRLSKELQQANEAMRQHQKVVQATAMHFDTLYDVMDRDFHGAYVRGANQFIAVSNAGARAAKLKSHEITNLGRQFADLGVMAAMGFSPMMIMVSQGPQIADVFTTARQRGVGFKEALRELGTMAKNLVVAYGPLIAATAGVGAALYALSAAFSEVKRATDAAEEANRRYNDVLAQSREAINGVAIATWKLADARKEAARQAIAEAVAANKAEIARLERPGFMVMAGRVLAGQGGAVAQQAADRQAERLRAQNATMLAEGIALIADTARDAENAYNSLIPRMRQIEEIERQRATLQDTIRGGTEALTKAGLTEAQAREAIAEADKKIADLRLSPEQKKAAQEAEAAAKRAAAQAKARVEASDEYILKLRQEIEEIGKTEAQVRALQIARAAAAAPLAGQKAAIQHLGEEREAALAVAEAHRQAKDARKSAEDFLLNLRKERAEWGLSAEAIWERNAALAEMIALLDGYPDIAATIAKETAEFKKQKDALKELIAAMEAREEALEDWISLEERLLRVADAAQQVGSGFDQIHYSLKNNDWMSAAQGLIRAALSIRDAYRQAAAAAASVGGNGKLAGQIAVGGSIATAVGPMIGGKWGSALSGAGTGAMMGAQLGSMVPGIGTAVGAVVGGLLGGIGGLLGGSSAKKRAQEEENRRRIEAELARQIEIGNAKREMEWRILELQGRSVEALAQRRAYEKTQVDASLHALLDQTYALEDYAEALAKATAHLNALKGIEVRILELSGRPLEALAKQRQIELDAMEAALRPFAEMVFRLEDLAAAAEAADRAVDDAKETLRKAFAPVIADAETKLRDAEGRVEEKTRQLTDAYNREAQALTGVIDRMGRLATTLREFSRGLGSGPLAMLDPQAQVRASRAEFERAASATDEAGMSGLPGASQAYLQALRAVAPDARTYAREVARVRQVVDRAAAEAEGQVDVAERQLQALNESVARLIDIGGATVSVEQAIRELIEARALKEVAAQELQALHDQLNVLLGIHQGVLSIPEAIAGLGSAMAAQASAQAALAQAQQDAIGAIANAIQQAQQQTPGGPPANDNAAPVWTAAGYLANNPDVAAEYARHTSASDRRYLASLGVTTAEDFARRHWETYGQFEDRRFNTGGSFTVGGSGGADSQFMPLWLTPGEMVDVRRPGANDNGALVAELRAQNALLRAQNALLEKTARSLDDMNKTGVYARGISPGTPVETEAA